MKNYPALFPKAEKLCGIKAIDDLFASGKTVTAPLFRIFYSLLPESEGKARSRILISIPKKIFKKAITRNLLKRRVREAYRKNKYLLLDSLDKTGFRIEMAVVWRDPNIAGYQEIETSMKEALNKLSRLKY